MTIWTFFWSKLYLFQFRLIRNCQFLTSLFATACQYFAAIGCLHSSAKTVYGLATAPVWLKCTFHVYFFLLLTHFKPAREKTGCFHPNDRQPCPSRNRRGERDGKSKQKLISHQLEAYKSVNTRQKNFLRSVERSGSRQTRRQPWTGKCLWFAVYCCYSQ